ncbi:5'-methylthioadenosine/S-adenosylhomocysteine nucleosidase family protein [Nocardiopsis suaedae]|uniref:5'-methylthioadenosine/S-adenosylhomocysteine nucleosidase n=1 Tax=Nocardiopsis suaedae TaxID=3018444 RepID=A0ABT4TQA2_9ACTN|nr:5'-methylthioadenosine/S-adenosylhomocysteine nucleosidase [Nocardiopsis suaedae]MDA2806865.1 5'-methylthioadenosine/S-adenosylhomocysteine nucleosidase [Nocardiopsis suaedae]
MTSTPVAVLTAFNLEYEAVRRRLVAPRTYRHERGTRFEIGSLTSGGSIVLGLTGKGNHPAAVLAERVIQEFAPHALLFVGVAGALWDATPLGDVVMATQVYAYHGGTSEDDGLKARPRAWEAPHEISQIGAHLGRVRDWAEPAGPAFRTPEVHFGPIAAGEVVQNSRISSEARWIRNTYNDALAIEMEAAGVAQAGHLNGSPVAVIRGISDRADGTKATDDDRAWQPVAAANAAAFATCLAEEIFKEQEQRMMHPADFPKGWHTVNNDSSGRVGIQAGSISGTNYVYMTSDASEADAPALAEEELRRFRIDLVREHSSGTIDALTLEAAETELDLTHKALEAAGSEERRRAVLPLRRLRGLVTGNAALEARVDGYITAAQGAS